jgi:hypothetical protein
MMYKKTSRFHRWFIPVALLISVLLAMTPVCLTTPAALGETPPSIQWSQPFGGSNGDVGVSVQPTADGGYVIAGTTYSYGAGISDVWLIKTNASGNKVWDKTYGGWADDSGSSVQQTADGGYVLAGTTYSYGAGGYDVWLIKTDGSGNQQWAKTFGGSDDDWGLSVQQTADGGYVVTGYFMEAGGGDVCLIKTDASGNQEWAKTFGGSSGDVGYSVQELPSGGYVVAGGTFSYGAGGSDVWLICTNASGTKLWDQTYGGAGDDVGCSMQVTADGDLVVAGYTDSYGAGGSDVWLIRTDSMGAVKWQKFFGGSDQDEGWAVQQTSDGGFVVAGNTRSYGAGLRDIWLIKTDGSGNQQWQQTFGDSLNELGRSVLQTADGEYVVAGGTDSYGVGSGDVWLVKTTDCTPPPAPALLSPSNGAVINDNTPYLDWADVADPSGIADYRIQVDSYSHFPDPVVDLTVTASEYTVEWTLPDGPYFWRVYAFDGAGNYSLPSAVWSFSVDTAAPPVPTLISPADGAVINDSTPILGWSEVTDPSGIGYWVQVDPYSHFPSPVVDLAVTPPEYAVASALADGLYYWRVYARDGAGNYSLPSAVWSFTVDTTAPPEVATDPATGEGSTVATLNGHLTSLGSASSVEVSFEWGLTAAYGNATPPLPVTDPGDFNSPLEGLTPETTYHFRAKAAGDGTVYGDDFTFTTDATTSTPPEVATSAPAGIATTTATLNGNLSGLGTASPVEVFFEWGLTAGYGEATTPQAVTGTGAFSAPLSALTPGTTYHFRAVAMGDGMVYGDDMAFTTDTAATAPPAVTTVAATGIGSTVATLNGVLAGLGSASSVEVSFEWGLTAAYGNATTAQAMTAIGTFNFPLEGLNPATTYHFRAKAEGNGTVYADEMTFTTDTAATTPPELATTAATGIGSTVATLNGSLTGMGTASPVEVSFELGLTAAYGNATAPQAMTGTGAFNSPLEGLTSETTYHFRAKAEGDGTVYGDDMSFTIASAATTPPQVATTAATGIGGTAAALNGNLSDLGTASPVEVSFDWGPTAAYGNSTTAQTMTAAGAFSASLGSLTLGTTYHFRAKAVGDGTVYGDDMTFTTDAGVADTTAPVISSVSASGVIATGATVTWTTDEAATSRVEHGLTNEYGSFTTLDTDLVTSHSVELTGLKAGQTYHYRVISTDASGNEASSPDFTLKTPGGSGGMPVWAWVIIGLAAFAVAGAVAFLVKARVSKA